MVDESAVAAVVSDDEVEGPFSDPVIEPLN
jgi:hypothetical protein